MNKDVWYVWVPVCVSLTSTVLLEYSYLETWLALQCINDFIN